MFGRVGDVLYGLAIPAAFSAGRAGATWWVMLVFVPVALGVYLAGRSAAQNNASAWAAAAEAREHAEQVRGMVRP